MATWPGKLYSMQSIGKFFSIVDTNKLTSMCSVEANVMRGRNKGLLRILNKIGVNCPLFSKQIEINSTTNIAVKIVNKLRACRDALTLKKLNNFLEN